MFGASVRKDEENAVAMRPEMPNLRVSRRGKIIIGVVVALFFLLTVFGSLVRVYTEWLWFGELHYRNVYRSILWSRVVLFLIFGFVVAGVIAANLILAYRMRPPFRPISQEQENLERYRVVLEPRKRLLLAAVVIIAFFAGGMAGQQSWKIWQLWQHGVAFGVKDPQFNRDIGFYAWDYPAYRFLLGVGFNAIVFSLLLSLAVHYVFGAFRIATPGPKLTISARRHVTVLVFFFVLLKAIAYWLDRYGLVFSNRGKTTGASYTDVHASLPAKTMLFFIAILIAIAVLVSLWLKSAQIAAIAFGVLLVMSIGINGIYPALVQQISVKPNASDKEAPYIKRNIDATRAAYDIKSSTDGGNVTYVNYPGVSSLPAAQLPDKANAATVSNIRLLDPNVVSPTFTQNQRLKNYYGFQTKLDIDRYTVGGETSDYIVGVRELKASNLGVGQGNEAQANWINKHTVYTHGYGLVAAKANKDVQESDDFDAGNIPVSGFLKIDKPQVYFGELGVDYSIVGAQGTPREDDEGGAQKITYDGQGGVSLGNIFNRLAFAIKYRQGNFVLNDVASSKGAKIIFDRDPRERVQKVAPFLTVDSDPYPSVINGRIVWIVDGYTTLNNYPYSQQEQLGDVTANSLSTNNRTARQANNSINYIRNSVKATVDAYDGTVNLYAWDESDPVLKTWSKVFPNLVQPKSAIPKEVLDHIRYPEDLFEVQRALLATYHVDNPVTLYNVGDKWTVPSDPYASSGDQPPYYLLAGDPTDPGTATYQLTSPMRVNSNENLAAYISVDAQSGASYGKFTVLKVPSGTNTFGPTQVANQFKSETAINTEVNLFDQGGSQVIYGNLLSLPVGDGFLYVEPLYVQGSGASQPLLRRVIVYYGNKVGYGDDLSSALRNLTQARVGQEINGVGGGSSTTPSTSPPVTTPPATSSPSTGSTAPGASPTTVDTILGQLDQAFTRLQRAYQSGDFQAVGTAQADVQRLLQAYEKARGSATPGPSASPKPS